MEVQSLLVGLIVGLSSGIGLTAVVCFFIASRKITSVQQSVQQTVQKETADKCRLEFEANIADLKANFEHVKQKLAELELLNSQQLETNSELSKLLQAEQLSNAGLKEKGLHLDTNNRQQAEQLIQITQLLSQLQVELNQAKVDKAQGETQINEERKNHQEKLALLKDAKEQLTKDFENLANRIFNEKQEVFRRQSQSTMETTLSPLREQLGQFRKKVEDVYEKENLQRQSLLHEITHLKDLNKKMSEEAINLTRALKGDKKAQGNWGEVILERVLEDSGLRKGREYETQVKLADEDGKRRYPDVIVRLPDNRDIIIDAKVSLVDYERYCSADNDLERETALQAHVQAMRNHIRSLSTKDYAHLETIRSLDFVFIFVPIEAAFLTAIEFDQGMFREAYDKNIIIVSPTTLLATLRTVESIWRYEKQSKNAEEIARQAGALHDQVVLVVETLDELGKHLERAQGAYDQTVNRLSKGRGNLISRTVNLEKLGAKAKKVLPKTIVESAELDAVDLEADGIEINEPLLDEPNGVALEESGDTMIAAIIDETENAENFATAQLKEQIKEQLPG